MSYFNRKGLEIFRKTNIALSESKLDNSQWIKLSENDDKIVYSFLAKNRLIVSKNGDGIEKQWEFIVDNDNLLIKDSIISFYNCHIVKDEFLILNKDNDERFEIFANLTKYKNRSFPEIKSNFINLFESISKNKELTATDKLLIIQIYELHSVLINGKNKSKARRILNNIVFDIDSGKLIKQYFQEIFNKSLSEIFNNSAFTFQEKIEIADPLLKYGILKKNNNR